MVGMTGSRSVQDEKLIEAVFTSHQPTSVRVQQSPASPQTPPQIYGATASCLIIDARPTTNAFANNLKGAGTENMEYYPSARKAYLGIDNIHIMRDSLKGVFEALRDAEMLEDQLGDGWVDRSALRRTGWLRHISLLLDGASLIIKTIHVSASHVLIHCSDGWDRTAQLSALAQICLDPYYRTLKGFQALVEKDWIGFGHKFTDRCGHLSSEKLFLSTPLLSSAQGEGNQAQAFLATVQHKLAGQGHLKEISPVFHQFLECVFNLQLQNPKRFEFNSKLLERIFYNVYSCRFGTFLFNTASERAKHPQLASLWAWAFDEERKADWLNPDYDATLDDPLARDEAGKYGDMGVLTPNPKEVVFWTELYKREGMNPPPKPPTAVTEEGELVSGDTTPPSPPGDEVLVNVEAPTKTQSANHSSVPSPTPSPGPLSRSAPAFSSSSSTTTPVIGRTYSPPPVGLEETRSLAKSLSKDSLNLEGSAFSMRTQRNLNPGTTRSTSSVASSASNSPFPIPSLPPTTQISANVRSMWGRLSSGAAGALSAVQGAYEDLRATQNVSPSPSHSQDRELREPPQAEDGNRTMSTLPRSPVRAPVEDNPWATSSNRGQTLQRGAITDVFPAALSTSSRQNSMPYDPTITVDPLNPWASPTPNSTIRGNPLDRRTSSLKKDPLPPPPPPPTETPTPPAFSSSDPLGASTL
jgi:myotubularin-related protein 6/7/8